MLSAIKGLFFDKKAIKKAYTAGLITGVPAGMLLGIFLKSFLFWGVIAVLGGGGVYWGYRKLASG